MNWFVKRRNIKVDDEVDPCEHLNDGDTAPHANVEMDLSGVVGIYAMCDTCYTDHEEAEQNEPVYCHDCKLTFPRKETVEWRWYDFNRREGDEPLTICLTCKGAEKHTNRIANDERDYQREFGCEEPFFFEEEPDQ